MSEFKSIAIASISMIENYRDTEPVNEKDQSLIELANDIKINGVMQPILLRPDKKKKDHYQLIFGHRRYVAAKLAGLNEIPANIKEVDDGHILELQVTENLHRKDVHPMDEAKAFKAWKEKNNADTKEMAAKFAKSERYIAQRLSLNNLSPDIQKDFLSKKLTIAQAEVLAKINHDQQKELKRDALWGGTYSASVERLKSFIETRFMHKLDKAPWKRDDKILVPAAGSCSDCKKRTGCQAILFDDIAKDDRCLDGKCYNSKLNAFIFNKATVTMAAHPEYAILYNSYSETPDKKILSEAQKLGVKVYDSSNGFSTIKSTWGNYTVAQKGLFINGDKAGTISTVFIKKTGSAKASDKPTKSNLQQLIAGIEERKTRSEELDYEKVMTVVRQKVNEFIDDDKPFGLQIDKKMEGVIWFMLYDSVSYSHEGILEELLLDKDSNQEWENEPDAMLEAMLKLSPIQKANILLCAFMARYNIAVTTRKGAESFMLRHLASWLSVDIASIEAAQNAIAEKRAANANKRIEALKKATEPKAKKAVTKKAAPAKTVKKKSTKK